MPLPQNDPQKPSGRLLLGVPLLLSPVLTAGVAWAIPKARTFGEFRIRRAGTGENMSEELDEQTLLLREIRDSLRHEH